MHDSTDSALKDQLVELIAAANKTFEKPHHNLYKSLTKETVNSILIMCQTLSVNLQTMFRTIEVYDRFVVYFNEQMFENLQDMCKDETKEVELRIRNQAPLRMCSCIILASKLHGDNSTPSITTNKLKALLSKLGQTYKIEAILRSELRVFTYLKYELSWVTPFEIIEQIISLLNFKHAERRKVHHFAMLILEFCYTDHHQIYQRVWKSKKEAKLKIKFRCSQDFKSEREEFRKSVEFNIPLRAASTVACAAWIVNPGNTKDISEEISSLVSISAVEIRDLAYFFMAATIER